MQLNVLKLLQERWNCPPVISDGIEDEENDASEVQEQHNLSSLPGLEQIAPSHPEGSCAWFGSSYLGQACADVESGVARLKEIMRAYPIRPHLNQGGGSGFTYPCTAGWSAEHWDIVGEFSTLWFSAAGDAFIALYGRRMREVPHGENPWPAAERESSEAAPDSKNFDYSAEAGPSGRPNARGHQGREDF